MFPGFLHSAVHPHLTYSHRQDSESWFCPLWPSLSGSVLPAQLFVSSPFGPGQHEVSKETHHHPCGCHSFLL